MRYFHCLLLAATLLFTAPAGADQNEPRLDTLFDQLQSLDRRATEKAKRIQSEIWYLWYEHDSEKVNKAMERGLQALSQDRYQDAVAAFTRAIELDPEFAEAWNRRGTTYYVMGEYRKSLEDIERVLELEPRHFGALAGKGLCLRELGRPREALDAFEAALEINPFLENVQLEIYRLESDLRA